MINSKLWGLWLMLLAITSPVIFLAGCMPASGTPADGGLADYSMIIFIVLIIVFIYFTMIRPQRRQQKQHQQLTSQLKSGDRVVTAAGILGEITSVSDDSVVLKIESGATIRVTRNSIVYKRPQ